MRENGGDSKEWDYFISENEQILAFSIETSPDWECEGPLAFLCCSHRKHTVTFRWYLPNERPFPMGSRNHHRWCNSKPTQSYVSRNSWLCPHLRSTNNQVKEKAKKLFFYRFFFLVKKTSPKKFTPSYLIQNIGVFSSLFLCISSVCY